MEVDKAGVKKDTEHGCNKYKKADRQGNLLSWVRDCLLIIRETGGGGGGGVDFWLLSTWKPLNRGDMEPNRINHHVWLQRALLLGKSYTVLL